MFDIGELVINRETGRFGIVVGYGHQVVNYTDQPTLRVKVRGSIGHVPLRTEEEDITTRWLKA